MADEKDFRVFLQNKKVPLCVLDQKWHRLFSIKGKPESVTVCEQELDELLKKQGQLHHELKELKKLKSKLMGNIVENMEGTHQENVGRMSSKKLDEDKRLIDDINAKMEEHEDALLELPREIDRVNKELMLLTVEFCYGNLRSNVAEIREITDWITQVRIDLKKNIIKKQNREINSRQMYAYMHDVFGAQMMDVFDLDNGDIDLRILEAPKNKPETEQRSGEDGSAKLENAKPAADGSVTAKGGTGKDAQQKKENFETK